MEQSIQGQGNHVIAALVDEDHVVTTLERVDASCGAAYIVFDHPFSGHCEGQRFIRGFSYIPEVAQGTYYRCTGVTVPIEEIQA